MIEIIIQPDGSLLIPRGTASENEIVRQLMNDVQDPESLDNFFAITENCERLFGDQFLCG